MAVIVPKHGEEKQVAQRLLALTDNVFDVKTTTDNGLAFIVPEELYLKYLQVDEILDEEPVDPDQVKRRPGRPRKVAVPKEGE